MSAPRAYRQLQQALPMADTPAQTSAVRTALVLMLQDVTYPAALKSAPWVAARLDEVWWNDTHRAGLEALALRWATTQQLPWLDTLRKAIGYTGEEERQPPPHSLSTERIDTMSTMVTQYPIPGNENDTMADLTMELDLINALRQQARLLRIDAESGKTTITLEQIAEALRATEEAHVVVRGKTATVRGREGTLYTVNAQGCSCDHQKSGDPYGCWHVVAVGLLHKATTALQDTKVQGQMFSPPKTVDERLRETPQDAPSNPQEPSTPADAGEDDHKGGNVPTAIVEPQEPIPDAPTTAVVVAPPTFASVARLETQLDEWAQTRAVITRFLQRELHEGLDYGSLHIAKDCKTYKDTKVCKFAGHWSKKILFKPGSEKTAGLLQLRPTFERDEDTWEMMGKPAGVLCLRCLLLTPSGEIAGEGRGARDIHKQDYGDINKGVKQCQKSAQIDAVLRTIALSDVFTQDLDGQEEEAPTTTPETLSPLKEQQLDEIKTLMKKLGFTGTTMKLAQTQIRLWMDMELEPGNYREILAVLKYRLRQQED